MNGSLPPMPPMPMDGPMSPEEDVRRERLRVDRMLAASPAVHIELRSYGASIEPVWVSPNIFALLGYKAEECFALGWWQSHIHPDDWVRAHVWADKLFDPGHWVGEYRFRHKNGEYRWLRDEGRVVERLDSGLEIVLSWSDVTDLKAIEHGRRIFEARVTRLIDATLTAIAQTEIHDDLLVFLNPTARRLFGLGPDEEIAGRRFSEFLPPMAAAQVALECIPDAFATGSWQGESTLRDANGQEIPVQLQVLYHEGFGPEERLLAFLALDISAQKEAESELRLTKEAAERANHAKTDFLSLISHELRTPLTSILGFAEMLADGIGGELTPRQQSFLENILTSGRDLLGLINDLLDLVKIEAGKVELEAYAMDVGSLVEDITGAFTAIAGNAGLHLEVEIERPLPMVQVDARRFKQMLLNYLSNAVKFTPSGGTIRVRTRSVGAIPATPLTTSTALAAVEQSLKSRPGSWLVVEVEDSGAGIAAEDFNRLFEAFEQLGTRNFGQPGTGLGLALTRRLAELHGGLVWAESAGRGEGSTFAFALPMIRREKSSPR
jgi:PAS domain S-box-containing protein